MVTAETKIFSVAVQPGRSDTSSGRPLVLRDVEGQMVDRPVILNRKLEDNSDSEFQPVLRDNEPAPAPLVMEREREREGEKETEEKKDLMLPPISDNNCQPQPQPHLLQCLYSASKRWRVINNAA